MVINRNFEEEIVLVVILGERGSGLSHEENAFLRNYVMVRVIVVHN